MEHMKENLKINKMTNREEIQRNLTNVYYNKLMEEISKQEMPFLSSVEKTSNYVFGKDVRRYIAHVKDGKIIGEEINVGLSNIYVDIDVPKNLVDYNWFCEKVAQSVSETMVEKCTFGFIISHRSYATDERFYGIDDAVSTNNLFYNIDRDDFRKSPKIKLFKSEFNDYSFANTLYNLILELKHPYNEIYKYPDHMVCGQKMLPLFESMFYNMPNVFYNKNNRWYLDFNGSDIPPICVNFLPKYYNDYIRLLNSSTFTLHQLCDWCWLPDEDGKILKEKDSYNYKATLVKYCNLICINPQYNGIIELVEER